MLIGEVGVVAYTISYGDVNSKPQKLSGNGFVQLKRLCAIFCVLAILLVWIITPVRVAVLDFLLPGNGPVTRQASQRFFQNLKQGQPIKTAFSEFCIEIVENA